MPILASFASWRPDSAFARIVCHPQALVDGARQAAIRAIEAFGPIDSSEWSHLKNDVRESVQRYIYDTIKRNPMILPIIVEI